MFSKTSAIILNCVKYSENSMILHAFTEEHGRTAYVVNGIKSKKCVIRPGLLLPLSIVELEAEHHPKKELQRIKESKVSYPFTSIPFNPIKNSIALFLAEVLFRSLKETEKNESLYRFLIQFIVFLDETNVPVANFHLYFLLRFSAFLGFYPNTDNERDNSYFDLLNGCFINNKPLHTHFLTREESALMRELLMCELDSFHHLPCTRHQRNSLLERLLEYYQLHLSEFGTIKSLEVLKELFI